MLVLSRRVHESIVVPDIGLTITVLKVDGHAVRLGFTAPDDVTVFREEVWLRLNHPLDGFAAETIEISEGG